MQSLSDSASKLVQRLYDRGSRIARLFSRLESNVAIIEQLQATGELGVVCHLVPFIFLPCEVGSAARRAITSLVENISTSQLWQLDSDLRFSSPWSWDRAENVRPEGVSTLSVESTEAPAVFGVLSCHPSGYVRERAVLRLSEIHDGREVSYLLLRMNDWVTQVRESSKKAILARIDLHEFGGLFENLEALFRVAECQRAEHSTVVARVVAEMASVQRLPVFANVLASASRFARRSAYRATVAESHEPERLIQLGLESSDGVVRLWAARDAAKSLPDDVLKEMLSCLLTDTFMPVRRQAIVCQMERFPGLARMSLVGALLDRNPGLRNFAQFYLRKDKSFSVPDYYRSAVTNDMRLPTAIAGLGETGVEADFELLLPFRKSQRPSIRASSIRSLGMLAETQCTSIFIEAIGDDHKKVSAEAVAALGRRAEFIDIRELRQVYLRKNRRHVLMATNRLLGVMEFWSCLPIAVELSASSDPSVSVAAQSWLRSRQNRVFTSPSFRQLDEIVTILERNIDRLPAEFSSDFNKWLSLRKSST